MMVSGDAPDAAARLAELAREHERALVELGTREQYYRSLIENAQDLIVVIADGLVQYESPAVFASLGYRPEERVGRSALELVHPDDASRALGALADAAREPGRAHRVEFRVRHRDGSWRALEAVGHGIVDGGRCAVVLNARDVTDRNEVESQLRRAQRMEAVARLAGGVAHDFNNLLTVIVSYGEFARDAAETGSPLRADVEQVLDAARRAAKLTRQLLAFGRRQTLDPKVLRINDVVSDLEKMLARVIGEDVELSTELSPSAGCVCVDPVQLEQVLMNLVVNARDAMPAGGRLTIATGAVTLDEVFARRHPGARPGAYSCLSVQDTGVGMDAATLARIFEPFFTTKGPERGTGLGLSTVYGIVTQSGGQIEVESEPGRGSVFRVYLPRAEPATCVAEDPGSSRADGARVSESVLLVEDDDAVRAAAERALRSQGYRVLVARNAGEAILLAERHPGTVHALVADVVMPLMGGLELTERLRGARPGLPALLVSGYLPGEGLPAMEASAVLMKPFRPAELTRRLRELLDAQPG